MKPESIKTILRSYLKEKQHSSTYDAVDGFGDIYGACGHLSGEPFESLEDRAGGLLFMEAQPAGLPLEEIYVPLPPEIEVIAIGIGRQLSEMSDEFAADRSDAAQNQGFANGNKSVQFKEHIIRVSPTCDRISISVIRAGTADDSANVAWRTCDKSAKAGLHYVNSQGNISFAQGDKEKIIEIEITTNQEKKCDICFAVELFDPEEAGNESYNTLMVYIVDDSKLYPEERQVIENIFSCTHNISMSEIVTRLSDNVTHNTFKAALQCLCSTANSIPKELALASELVRLTFPRARLSSLTNVLCDFFSYLPELENIASMFDKD